jgi:hypothetical protein
MTRVTPTFGSRKTLNFTYQNPQETLLSTPETLPTSEPATAQISYTVQDGYLPATSLSLASKKYIAYLIGAGKFTTAGTLGWRMKKNGSSVATSSASVSANTFYTLCAFFHDVALNDTLEIALWSNQTDSNWDYKACSIYLSRPLPFNVSLLSPVNFTGYTTSYPNLTLGSPSVQGSDTYWIFVSENGYMWGNMFYSAVPKTVNYMYNTLAGGGYLLRVVSGDESNKNNAVIYQHASYRPYYRRPCLPTSINFRRLLL